MYCIQQHRDVINTVLSLSQKTRQYGILCFSETSSRTCGHRKRQRLFELLGLYYPNKPQDVLGAINFIPLHKYTPSFMTLHTTTVTKLDACYAITLQPKSNLWKIVELRSIECTLVFVTILECCTIKLGTFALLHQQFIQTFNGSITTQITFKYL